MHCPRFLIYSAILFLLTGIALQAQPNYSIDIQGPTVGLPDAAGLGPITEGDILNPVPPGTPPLIMVPAIGIFPALVPPFEVDALSFGLDTRLQPGFVASHDWFFSVDEWAVGIPGIPAPSVTSEAALAEASSDIYFLATPPGPVPPAPGPHLLLFDGDGIPGFGPPLNLVEPNPPGPGLPDVGDNLDALEFHQPPGPPFFYSLDSAFPDPLEIPGPPPPPPPNFGTAFANGFVGGDVLLNIAPLPVVFAPAILLGLDADGTAPDIDDVDALVIWDDGDLFYQPTTGPYSWLNSGHTDMILYSVRRGSAIIGAGLDAILGLPVEEGDILVPVFDVVDGVPVFDAIEGDWDPGIFIAAETLGLDTVRGGVVFVGDDLNALDADQTFPANYIFADGFEEGDTSHWSSVSP